MGPNPVLFFAVVTLLAVAIHLYLWWRLVRSTVRSRRNRRIGAAVIAVLGAFGLIGLVVTRTVGVDTRWLAWIGYGWIAVMFYVLLTLIVLEIPRGAYALWWRRRGSRTEAVEDQERSASMAGAPQAVAVHSSASVVAPARSRPRPEADQADGTATAGGSDVANPDRRLFLARACALAACGVGIGAVADGMRTAFGDLRTVRVTTPITGLDPRLAGFRIAAVSDTHFGPFMREPLAERIVTAVNRERADMVVVLGDIADGSVEEVGHAAEPMRRFESRRGTYFVTGNHDYSSGVDAWMDQVRELGMRPLLNERVEIASGGTAFELAGVNDLFATMYDKPGPDFAAALQGRDPGLPLVLLAHQPVQVHEAMKHGVDLQLSGHTHGGQTVPFDRLAGLQQPLLAGLARMGDTSLFVTRGAGFFGPPIRVGIPPEVAIVELQPRAGA